AGALDDVSGVGVVPEELETVPSALVARGDRGDGEAVVADLLPGGEAELAMLRDLVGVADPFRGKDHRRVAAQPAHGARVEVIEMHVAEKRHIDVRQFGRLERRGRVPRNDAEE